MRNEKMDALLRAVNGNPQFDAVNAAATVSHALAPKPLTEIKGFFGPFRFLSNFHFKKVCYEGEVYATTEHAYQAAKTLDLLHRKVIQAATAPRDARRLGQEVVIRPGWFDGIRDEVMLDVNMQKFADGSEMVALLSTGDAYLEETNTWGDIYWGVSGGIGENRLGKVLMQIRDHLHEVQAINSAPPTER